MDCYPIIDMAEAGTPTEAEVSKADTSDELGSFLADNKQLEDTRAQLQAEINPAPEAPTEDPAKVAVEAAAKAEAEAAAEKARQVGVDAKLKELVGREDLIDFLQKGNRDAVLVWNTHPETGENTYPAAVLTKEGKISTFIGNDTEPTGRIDFKLVQVDNEGKYTYGSGSIQPQFQVDGVTPSAREFAATNPDFIKGGVFVMDNISGKAGMTGPLAESRYFEKKLYEKGDTVTPESIQATLMIDLKEPASVPQLSSE